MAGSSEAPITYSSKAANVDPSDWNAAWAFLLTYVDANGYIHPKTSTNTLAPNNSIYYSSDQSALCYKNGAGVVSTFNLTAV